MGSGSVFMLWQIFWIQIMAYYSLHICIKIIISTEDIFLGFFFKEYPHDSL